jgi:hypothetical protein
MAEDTDEWAERLLVATADDIDEWPEKLLVELECVSTNALAGNEEAFAATPSAIEWAIREQSAGIDPKLLKSYYRQAKSHFDNLVRQGHPYAETLRRASLLLSL